MAEDRKSEQPEKMLSMLTRTAARSFNRRIDEELRSLGINASQLPVFALLNDGNRLSSKQLANLIGVEQPSMTQLLARMERDGLIRREVDANDRRSALVSLTAKAEALHEPGRALLREVNAGAVAGLSASETEILKALLSRVIGNLSPD